MKRILVVGATSGIAQEACRIFAARGDALVLVARNADRLAPVAEDARVRGAAQVETIVMDASDLAGHEALPARADAALGGLDAVLVAHGSLGDQKAAEREFAVAHRELVTNFLSVVAVATGAANLMEARRAGVIAVISSVAGDRGRQSNYVYGTGKAGVSAFLQGLRNRLHPAGVGVVTIKPGFVDTPMTAHLKKGLLFASAQRVARGIVRAMDTRRDVVYVPGFWWAIMFIIRHVPETLFKRLRL